MDINSARRSDDAGVVGAALSRVGTPTIVVPPVSRSGLDITIGLQESALLPMLDASFTGALTLEIATDSAGPETAPAGARMPGAIVVSSHPDIVNGSALPAPEPFVSPSSPPARLTPARGPAIEMPLVHVATAADTAVPSDTADAPAPDAMLSASPASAADAVTTLVATDWASLISALRIISANASNAGALVTKLQIGAPDAPVTIALGGDLPALNPTNLVIEGNGSTIDGQLAHNGFFVESGTLLVKDLTLRQTVAQGGTGGSSKSAAGGGGAGLGGGIFVNTGAKVSIQNVTFDDTRAIGGAGGDVEPFASWALGGGGGGGMGSTATGGRPPDSNSGTGPVAGGGGGGFHAPAGAAGLDFHAGPAGNGSGTTSTIHYFVVSTTETKPGGYGGNYGGGGGRGGLGGGGGGGGIGGRSALNKYNGGFGFDLTFSGKGAIFELLALSGAISPGMALGLMIVNGLYSAIATELGSPGYVDRYTNFTLSNHGGLGTTGVGVPGLSKAVGVPLFGLGLSVLVNTGATSQMSGAAGGLGGGGGGGGVIRKEAPAGSAAVAAGRRERVDRKVDPADSAVVVAVVTGVVSAAVLAASAQV